MTNQERLLYNEQLKVVYGQTGLAVVGGFFVGVIFIRIFWDVTDHTILLSWLACLAITCVIRLPVYFSYTHRQDDGDVVFWSNLFTLFSFTNAVVWGSVWLVFFPIEDPIYPLIAALWAIGFASSSVSAYSISVKVTLSVFLPVMLPAILYLFLSGSEVNIYLGSAMSIYIAVIIRAILPVNRSMLTAIRLNFEKEKEIEERIKVENKLQLLSLQDPLTGLSNRRHLDEVLSSELRRAQRESSELSLIMIDIDSFKMYNDTYGHQQGDTCLKQVCAVIQQTVHRPGDLAARYGGEEFALVLPNTKTESASLIAASIREKLFDQNITHSSTDVEGVDRVTISAGIVTIKPEPGTTVFDIVQLADDALYNAKANGRNTIVTSS